MCGPTLQEKSLQQSSQNFSSMLQQNYGTLFSKQLDVLNAIGRSLNPILAAGPNQRGMSAEELNARNTQAINAAGAASRSAQQAARTYGAGEGGGATSGVTSGITKQIESAIGSSAANAEAGELDKLTSEDYQKGSENYWRAQGGMEQLAQGYNPNAASSGAVSENQASFGEASAIQQAEAQKSQMIAGGITSLATMALPFAGGMKAGLAALGGPKPGG